ncbi:MAG: mandelate racemase/muconate lactonizing enzyme family protein [Candidatus Bathyarchaeia archaeon]
MKIKDLKVAVVEGNFDWPLIKIETDEGIEGYGEVRDGGSKNLALDLKPLIIGEDPLNLNRIFRKIQGRGGYGRQGGGVSAIEMALWDIAGKALGMPVHRLLGGRYRDKVKIYCDCHAGKPIADAKRDYRLDDTNYTPDAYAENARRIKAMGFSMLKFDVGLGVASLVPDGISGSNLTNAGLRYLLSIVEALRNAVGEGCELALDCGMGTVSNAIRFGRAVEPFRLAWLEDLISFWDVSGFREVTTSIDVPTLTGEDIYLAQGFRDLIERHAIRIPSPDLATVGGIRETVRTAEMAELHGMGIAPHFAGSPISFMANVHAASVMPNLIALEFHAVGVPWWDSLVEGVSKPIIKNGLAEVPEAPGLGVEPNEKEVRKHLKEGEGYFE